MKFLLRFVLKYLYYPIPIKFRLMIGKYLLIKLNYITFFCLKIYYAKHNKYRKTKITNTRKYSNTISLNKYTTKATEEVFCSLEESGVNIIGVPSGTNGIAVISRLLGEYLMKNNIAVSYINSPFRKDREVCKINNFQDVYFELNAKSLKYKTNIFSINFHNMPYYQLMMTKSMVNNYNIGYFPWEIDYIDNKFKNFFVYIDEVWVYSEFVKRIFEKFFKNVNLSIPVKVMNVHKIDTSIKSNKTRKDFDLPDNKFIFYFTFDPYSSIPRKNPIATIKAFSDAFCDNNDAFLAIKMKPMSQDLYHLNKELCDEFDIQIKKDKKIKIIDKSMSYSDVLALANCCDCLVSLHRSEGLGLNILEALELGKPVIVTNYSANVEFAQDEKYRKLCYFVNYKMVKVNCDLYNAFLQCSKKNKHLAQWAEPDIHHASKLMLEVYQRYKSID